MRHAAVAPSLLGLAWVTALIGCSSAPHSSLPDAAPPDGAPSDAAPSDAAPSDAAPPKSFEYKDIPLRVNRKVDILFLVDDSPSMGDKQTNLADNFPRLIDVLATLPGGLPDIHIGVATSDLGTKGANDAAPGPSLGTIGQGGCAGFGKDGDLQLFGATSMVTRGNFISDTLQVDGVTRVRNYTGNISDVFAQMARAGAGGCGFEQHLEAVKQALDPNHVANAGFVRDDAYLAVIVIADEDDCSMSHSSLIAVGDTGPLGPLQSFRCTRFGVLCDDGGATPDAMNQPGPKTKCHPSDDMTYLAKVADYAAFLKSLKPDPNNVVVAGIAGTLDPFATELRVPSGSVVPIPALAHSCTYIGGDGKPEVADPPVRIKAFLDQFPNRSAFAPICQQDLSGGLQQIGDLLKTLIVGDPCIEGTLADVDPTTPGPQSDCQVSAVTGRGSLAEYDQVLPRCTPEDSSATNQPCWHLATDPANCPNGDHFSLKIEGQMTLPSDAHVIANCAIQPN